MSKLLQNERVKLYKKTSTWVLSGILVGLMLFSVLFVKIVDLFFTSYVVSSSSDNWESEYAEEIHNYQQAIEEYPDEPYYVTLLNIYQHLLREKIAPDDWRVDVVHAYYEELESAEAQYEGNDPERHQQLAASYLEILNSGDWKDLLRLRIDMVNRGENVHGINPQTEKEKAAIIEVLELQIELGIPPVPVYGYDNDNQWKADALATLRTNKLSLLRGENINLNMYSSDYAPLTASDRVRIEQENAVLLERLRTDAAPISEDSFLGMLDSSAGNLDLIPLLIMVLAGGLIAGEFSSGTVKLLLITPHRRQKIYWAKAVLLLELTAIITGAMFLLSFLLSAAFNGFDGIGQMQVMSLFGQVVRLPFLLIVAAKYLLSFLPVVAYGSLAFMLSATTRKSSVAIAVSLIVMYGSQMILGIVSLVTLSLQVGTLPGVKFLLFANDNLSAYLPSSGSLLFSSLVETASMSQMDPSMTLGFSVAVLLVYTACFLWIGRDSFCRRDVK